MFWSVPLFPEKHIALYQLNAILGEKRGKKRREKTDDYSGHYVIASSRPPERCPLVPIIVFWHYSNNPNSYECSCIKWINLLHYAYSVQFKFSTIYFNRLQNTYMFRQLGNEPSVTDPASQNTVIWLFC